MKRNTTLKGLVATLVIGAALALPSLASAQGRHSHSGFGVTIQFGSRGNSSCGSYGYGSGYGYNSGYGGYNSYGYNSHRAQESHAYNDHRAAEAHAFRDHQYDDWYYGASPQHRYQEEHAYRDHRAAERHQYNDHRRYGGGW